MRDTPAQAPLGDGTGTDELIETKAAAIGGSRSHGASFPLL